MSHDEADEYRLSTSVGYQLGLTARLHERRLERRLAETGISRADFTVLCAIGRESCTTPSDVAEFLQVEKSAISRILRDLRSRGLVIEGVAISDKRVRLLGLSDRGRKLLSEGVDAVVSEGARIRHVLNPREIEVFRALLEKVRAMEGGRRQYL